MIAQKNDYLSKNIIANKNRSNGKRLGDRELFSEKIDGKRYYSSIDAEIYFGDVFIDDIVQLNWTVQQATMPIFGYNSYVFDDLAIGVRQVAGSMIINFTKSGMLYDILEKLTAVDRASLYTYSQESYKLGWSSNFEKEHEPSWNRSFNIRVGYGDYNKGGVATTMNVLYCVQITGCQQVLSADGGAIGEVYTFIAKDVRHENNTEEANSNAINTDIENGFKKDNKEESFAVSITDIKYLKENNEWYFILKCTNNNGDIEKISFRPKEPNNVAMINTYELAGNSNYIKFKISKGLSSKIDNSVNNQKGVKVEDKFLKLLTDIKIEYSRNGKHAGTVFKSNIVSSISM